MNHETAAGGAHWRARDESERGLVRIGVGDDVVVVLADLFRACDYVDVGATQDGGDADVVAGLQFVEVVEGLSIGSAVPSDGRVAQLARERSVREVADALA